MGRMARIRTRWTRLRYWQKGALLGASIHLLAVISMLVATLVIYWLSPDYGDDFNIRERHIAELLGFMVLIFFRMVDALPMFVLQLFGAEIDLVVKATTTKQVIAWTLYILYATVIYSVLGIIIAESIKLFQRKSLEPRNGSKTP